MLISLRHLCVASAGAAFSIVGWAQNAVDARRPPAVLPLEAESDPAIVPYPPIAEALSRGVVIIQYRTENFRVMPVFGQKAVEVSPRVGHLHVTVDDRPGTWAHTSEDPIIVVGLKPGEHKILLELANPSHKVLTSETVSFTVPEQKAHTPSAHR